MSLFVQCWAWNLVCSFSILTYIWFEFDEGTSSVPTFQGLGLLSDGHNPSLAERGQGNLKWPGSFFKANISIVAFTLVSPKKYLAKNLELCGPRNLLFSTAVSAMKLQFGGF